MPVYNPARLIEAIRTDNVHGADWLSNAAVSVIATASLKEPAKTVDELHERLWGYAIELAGCRPSMAPLVNKLGVLFSRLDGIDDIRDYRARATEFSGLVVDESIKAKKRLVEHLKTVVDDVETVFTYSNSATVRQAIRELGIRKVIVTESRPQNEGVSLAQEFAAEGRDVLLGVDAAVHMYMNAADVVLVGADSVQYDGSVINKVGTSARGSLVPAVMGFSGHLLAIYFVSWLFQAGFGVPITFNVVFFSGFVGFMGVMTYSFLTNLEHNEYLNVMPVSVDEVVKAKLVIYFVITSGVTVLYVVLIGALKGEMHLVPMGLVVSASTSVFVVAVTAYLTGLWTNTMFFSAKTILKFTAIVVPPLTMIAIGSMLMQFMPGTALKVIYGTSMALVLVSGLLFRNLERKWRGKTFSYVSTGV